MAKLKFKRGNLVTPNTTIMKGERAVVVTVDENHDQQYDIQFSNGEIWMYAEHELDAL